MTAETIAVYAVPWAYWTTAKRLQTGMTEAQAAVNLGRATAEMNTAYLDMKDRWPVVEITPKPAHEWTEAELRRIGLVPAEIDQWRLQFGVRSEQVPALSDSDEVAVSHVPTRPGDWFNREGLLSADLAGSVAAEVPIRRDRGDFLWTWRSGVWRPDVDDYVRTAVCSRLQNRSRPAHTAAVRHVLLGRVPRIDVAPVPDLLNVRNGLLDWRSGILAMHDPDVPSTVQLGAEWDPDATCPTVEAWLAEVLPADLLEPVDGGPGFVWELLGYLCMSGNPLHRAVLLLGSGRNGKGTFLRLLTALLGPENVSSVDLHSLVGNRFRAAELLGKVANIAGDLDARWLESTAVFKAITGGDSITAERKYGSPFDFTPFAVPVFSANAVFGSPDSSDGYMARWVVVPFPRSFLGSEDRALDSRLRRPDELAGVLVRAVEGLRAVMQRGNLPEPPSIAEAHDRFVAESDPVRAFLRDTTAPDVEGFIDRQDVWRTYTTWAADNGHRAPLARNALFARLATAGMSQRKRVGTRGFVGRRLTVRIVEEYPSGGMHLEPIEVES